MAPKFRLVAGLGNPTPRYQKTRHNAGFWFLDRLAAAYRVEFRHDPRFHGLLARLDLMGEVVYLLKPTTFMNRSGQSIGALVNYFKLETTDVLVAHDELDLAPGVARLKRGGGHGGHNGLRDLIPHLGSPDFYRLRFGIGHPGDRAAVIEYVLHPPSRPEEEQIEHAMDRAVALASELFAGRLELVMNRLHGADGFQSKKEIDTKP